MHALFQLADELGLQVVEKRVAHTSGYLPGDRMIALTPGMDRRTARCVLCHEIAHVVLEHRPTQFGPIRKRQEREANEWAVRYLIPLDSFIEVERIRDGHVGAMAHDLDVVPEFIDVLHGMLQRVGNAVYVKPRMGAGGYDRRVEVA